jgi:hypothetical protein
MAKEMAPTASITTMDCRMRRMMKASMALQRPPCVMVGLVPTIHVFPVEG